MRKPKETTTYRVDERRKPFLQAFAMQEGMSATAALDWLIADAERRHPVQLAVRHVLLPDRDFYVVCVGQGEQLWEGATLADAKAALAEVRRRHGLEDARRFPLAPEVAVDDLRDPPLALSEFNAA